VGDELITGTGEELGDIMWKEGIFLFSEICGAGIKAY